MNNGTESNSRRGRQAKTTVIDNINEVELLEKDFDEQELPSAKSLAYEMGEFSGKIELAKAEGNIIVEAGDQVIKKYVPTYDKEKAPKDFYFAYRGVLVCPVGCSEEVEKKLEKPMNEIMQPNDAKVVRPA